MVRAKVAVTSSSQAAATAAGTGTSNAGNTISKTAAASTSGSTQHPLIAAGTHIASNLNKPPAEALTGALGAAGAAYINQNGVAATMGQAVNVMSLMAGTSTVPRNIPPSSKGTVLVPPNAVATGPTATKPITFTAQAPGMKLLYRVLDKQKAMQYVQAPNKSFICTTGDIGDFHPRTTGQNPSYWTDSRIYAEELLALSPKKMVVMQLFPLAFLHEQRIGSSSNGNPATKVFYFPASPDQTWVDFVALNRGGVQPTASRNLPTPNFNVCVGPVSNCGTTQYTQRVLVKLKTLQQQIDNFQPYWIGEPNKAAENAGIEAYARLGKPASQWWEDQRAKKANAPFAMQYVFLGAGLDEICKPQYARGYATNFPAANGAGSFTWTYSSAGQTKPITTGPYNYNPIEHLLHENPASINANGFTTTSCAACKALSEKITP